MSELRPIDDPAPTPARASKLVPVDDAPAPAPAPADPKLKPLDEPYTPAFGLDPSFAGMSEKDFDVQEAKTDVQAVGRGALLGTAHLIKALNRPGEAILGRDTSEWGPRGVAEKLEKLIPEPPPATVEGQKVGRIIAGGIGGFIPGTVQYLGGLPLAVMSGFQTADEIAQAKGRTATFGEKVWDAGIEGVARMLMGGASRMEWGRVMNALAFGTISGAQSVAEGADTTEAGINAIASAIMGAVGRELQPRVQDVINAAREAARAGNFEGAMRQFDALIKDPQVAAEVAKAARQRDPLAYPQPSGDATHHAAELSFRNRDLPEGFIYADELPSPEGPPPKGPPHEEIIEEAQWEPAKPREGLPKPEGDVSRETPALPPPSGFEAEPRERAPFDRNAWKSEKLVKLDSSNRAYLGRDDLYVVPSTGQLIRITRNGNRARVKINGLETVEDIRRARSATAESGRQREFDRAMGPPPPGLPSPERFEPPMPPIEKGGLPDARRGPPAPQPGRGVEGEPPPPEWEGFPEGHRDPKRIGQRPEGITDAEWRDIQRMRLIGERPDPSGKPTFIWPKRMPRGKQTFWEWFTGTGSINKAWETAKATISVVIAQRDRANAFAHMLSDVGEELFKGIPDVDRVRMISNVMHGRDPLDGLMGKFVPRRPTDPRAPDDPISAQGLIEPNLAKAIRDWFAKAQEHQEFQAFAERVGADIDYELYYNYWPLMWKDESAAKAFQSSSRVGGPFFTRHKVFADPTEGIDAGLELKSSNPAVLWAWRQEAGNAAITRVLAMRDLVEDGLAVTEKDVNKEMGDTKRLPKDMSDWQTVDVGGTRYYVHPEAKLALERSLLEFQKALDLNNFVNRLGAGIWDAWMKLRNLTIPTTLALSGFHGLHVTGIDSAQPYAGIFTQALNRRMTKEQFFKALSSYKPTQRFAFGEAQSKNWPRPFSELSPVERLIQNLLIAGGYTPGIPSVYEIRAHEALRRQMNDVMPSLRQKLDKDGAGMLARAWKTTPEFARAAALHIAEGIEKIQKPMFGEWIPAIKQAAYVEEALRLIQAKPELVSGESGAADQLRLELNKIRKTVDDRYGEMQYEKEFWQPLWRKAMFGTLLSVGWNFGFVRQFGMGLLVDPVRGPSQAISNKFFNTKIQNEITNRMIYAGTYVLQSLIVGGMMTMAFTGDAPKDLKDLIYPRLPDGSRLNTMWFTREFGSIAYHIMSEGLGVGTAKLLAGKLSPAARAVSELVENSDYFGNEVYDSMANPFTQVMQGMGHFFKVTMEPISIQSVTSGQTPTSAQQALAMGGFGPAPKYVSRSRTVNDILSTYGRLFPTKHAYGEVERGDDLRSLRQIYQQWQKTRSEDDQIAYEVAVEKYAEKYPEHLGKGGAALRQSMRMWAKPEGLAPFQRLPTDYQRHIFERASLGEKAWLSPGLHKELRDLYYIPTPKEVAGFSVDDQMKYMQTVSWGSQGEYMPYLDPSVREFLENQRRAGK